MRRPKAILFDLGDTLLRHDRFEPLEGNKKLLSLSHNPHNRTLEEVARAAKAIEDEMRPLRASAVFEISARALQRVLFEPLGISFSLAAHELERAFWEASVTMSPEPGIEEVLSLLSEQGILAGVVSNARTSGELLWAELEKHRLERYFRFLMSSCDYGFRKPSPLLFKVASAKLGVPPEDTWFIGDSVANDIAGANASGMVSVWYNTKKLPQDKASPAVEIHHWDELRSLLGQL